MMPQLQLYNDSVVIEGLSGKANNLGKVTLSIQIGPTSAKYEFHVVRNTRIFVLLGVPILKTLGIVLDFKECLLKLYQHSQPFTSLSRLDEQQLLTPVRRTILNLRTVTMVECKTNFQLSSDHSEFHMIEEYVGPSYTKNRIFVPRSIVTKSQLNQRVCLAIINPTDDKITLNQKTGLNWKVCMVYIDDIIVFSENFDKHIQDLQAVFDRLSNNYLVLRPDKCSFCCDKMTFLGHEISNEGIKADPTKIEVIKNAVPPINVNEVRQFLGLASYYRHFIKKFAKISSPLSMLTGNSPFIWGNEQQKAFEDLKNKLISAPILAYPRFDLPFELHTDASLTAIGGVLSQIIDGHERVIHYGSRSLNPAEQNYDTTERECLAIHHWTKYFRCYLADREFTIVTDHEALKWLINKSKDTQGVKPRLQRWLLNLQFYKFKVVHRNPKKNFSKGLTKTFDRLNTISYKRKRDRNKITTRKESRITI